MLVVGSRPGFTEACTGESEEVLFKQQCCRNRALSVCFPSLRAGFVSVGDC